MSSQSLTEEADECARSRKKRRKTQESLQLKPRQSLFALVLSCANSSTRVPSKREPPIYHDRPLEILSLPDEVMGKCFFSGFVDSIDIIRSVTCVSKRTMRVARACVKLLDLRRLPQLSPSNVATIVKRHANLSTLDFAYCPQFSRQHLMALVPLSETLQILRLRGTSLQDKDIVDYFNAVQECLGGKPSRLQELDISVTNKDTKANIGDEAVKKITLCCPELKSLQLGWCKGVSDSGLAAIGRLRRLQELDLSLTSISDEGCNQVSSLRELQKLDLSATRIGHEGIQALVASDIRPTELKVGFNGKISEESLLLLASRWPSLKILDIRHCDIDKNEAKDTFRQLRRNGTTINGGG